MAQILTQTQKTQHIYVWYLQKNSINGTNDTNLDTNGTNDANLGTSGTNGTNIAHLDTSSTIGTIVTNGTKCCRQQLINFNLSFTPSLPLFWLFSTPVLAHPIHREPLLLKNYIGAVVTLTLTDNDGDCPCVCFSAPSIQGFASDNAIGMAAGFLERIHHWQWERGGGGQQEQYSLDIVVVLMLGYIKKLLSDNKILDENNLG